MCDALTYAQTFNPTGIVDLATLTGTFPKFIHSNLLNTEVNLNFFVNSHISKIGAIGVALGSAASGVYTNSSYLWENMHKVSESNFV